MQSFKDALQLCHYWYMQYESTKTHCNVTGFTWSTISLRFGALLENNVWIIMVHRASVRPHPFPGICYLQSQLHGTDNKIDHICPSSHALLYFHASHSLGPSGGTNLLRTWPLHSTGKKQALSIPGRGNPALMCHAICMDWLMLPLSSTPFCQDEQFPFWKCLGVNASVHTIPSVAVRTVCQNGQCPFGIRQLFVLLFALSCEWSTLQRLYSVGWIFVRLFTWTIHVLFSGW